LYGLLQASLTKSPAGGKPEFVILCVDNALIQEISDICSNLQNAFSIAALRVPAVATITAHLRNEATSKQLSKKANIFITTPGKLLRMIDYREIDITSVKKFVLDQVDCLLIYADDNHIERVLRQLRLNQHVIALTSRMTPQLVQRWKDLVLTATTQLKNMISLPDSQHKMISRISKYIKWRPSTCLADKPMECAKFLAAAPEGCHVLAIANFKVTVDAIVSCGRKLREDDFARHRAELPDPDERYKSLKGFKDSTYKTMVSTRRSIYGVSFPFLPLLVIVDIPSSYDELLYILQW
jgi:superfamily II DNA/RNA helicase